MSNEHLAVAYLDGRISRRTLVRRLVAGGVSFGAAVAYAQLLKPAPARGRQLGDIHFDASVEIPEQDLDTVVRKSGLRVTGTADRELRMFLDVFLLRPDHPSFPRSLLGSRLLEFPGAGSLTARVKFDENPPFSLKAVKLERRARDKAKFEVVAHAARLGLGARELFDQRTIRT